MFIQTVTQEYLQAFSKLPFACCKASRVFCAKPFHMEIAIHKQIMVHLYVNKTNFHIKGFTPRL